MDRVTEQLDELNGPFDLDAEMSFLGSLSICEDKQKQHRMRAMASADTFYQPDHGYIFVAMAAIMDDGRALDATTLRSEMRQRNTYDAVGGDGYLGKILQKVPSPEHGEHYGRIIEELHLRRLGSAVGRQLMNRLMRPALDDTATAVLDTAVNEVVKIRQRRSRVDVFSLNDIVADFMESKDEGKPAALMTGIERLDEFLGIFAFGKYTVIAGRPSMGKSSIVRWLLEVWASSGSTVGLVAVEEDRQKIAGNYLSSLSGVENSAIAYRDLDKEQISKVVRASGDLSGYQWYGVDTAFSINDVCSAIELLATDKKCRVIAVDHMHLISSGHQYESGHREIKEISRRLKEVGKRHNIVLIAAAQLSRPEKHVKIPPPPTLTDLRESGSIEEHADAAIMLHREDYYKRDVSPTHMCELIVAKNRNGRTGKTSLYEELRYQRFRQPTQWEAEEWRKNANQQDFGEGI